MLRLNTCAAWLNTFNQVLTERDDNGITTTNTYDARGNLTSTSRPATGTSCPCQVTTYRHQDSGHPGDVTSVVDPDGNVWTHVYDTFGNRTQSIDPLGNRSTSAFNADGWMTASYSPKGSVVFRSGRSRPVTHPQ